MFRWLKRLLCAHEWERGYWIPEEHLTVETCRKCGKTAYFEVLIGFKRGKQLKD